MKFCLLFIVIVALVKASTPEGYDKNEIPSHDRPNKVQIGAYVAFLESRPEENSLRGKMYFRQTWRDPRLMTGFELHVPGFELYVPTSEIDDYWLPDTFIKNVRKVERFTTMTDERVFKVNARGYVWFVQSLSFDLFCDFKSSNRAVCSMMFETYRHRQDELYFDWIENNVEIDEFVNSTLAPYKLTDTNVFDCSKGYLFGNFPCLGVRFILDKCPEDTC